MTEKNFDDYVRDKLHNHSSPVPDGLWEKIAKEKDRRPVGFFWNNRLLTALFFMAIIAIGSFLLWQNDNNGKQVTASSNHQTQTANQTGISTPTSINSNNSSINDAITTNNSQLATNKETAATASNNIIQNKGLSTKENNVVTTVPSVNANIPPFKVKKNTATNEEQQSNEKNKQWIASNKNTSSKKTKYNTVTAMLGSFQTGLQTADSHEQASTQQVMLSPNYLTRGEPMFIEHKKALSGSIKLPTDLKQPKLFNTVDCPSANGYARNDLYLEVYASPDYTFKSVMGNAASTAYLQKKDSSESMKVGYTVGARITKNMGEHLILKAGLQFSQINERFTLRTENERRTTTVITTRNITDAAANVTTVSDTSSITQIGYLVKTSNNYYRNIELPLMIGYEFGNDKLKFSLNGGAILNIAAWYKGNTLDTSYQSVAITKSGNDVYKHNIGVSIYGSLSIIKPFAERFDLFAEPYFRYSLSNMSSSTLGYNQRFSTMGLSFGIRYKLNSKKQHL